MKFTRESFETKREELTIRGTKFVPERANGNSPVIVSHGFMGNEQGVAPYAELLAKAGYTVFTFDFCGGGLGGRSDGDTRKMTVFTEVRDLEAVTAHALRDCGCGKVILMGCSQGGFVSGMTAAGNPEKVEKLILFFPALCIPDDARNGQMMFARFDPADIPEEIKCGPMTLGRDYAASVVDKDPYELLKGYTGPVLIVHGTEDKIVRLNYARRALELYRLSQKAGSRNAELVIIEGAGHGFSRAYDEKAATALREFLVRSVPFSGKRFVKKGGSTPDMVKRQIFADLTAKNEYRLDTRFVIRDGKKHPFALVIPGGGYTVVCSFIEGVPYARELNKMGISVFILYYRVKDKARFPGPQDDAARAVREILENADRFMVETENYSVWGSSAGGHLAASFGTESMGWKKYGLPRPGSLVLIYPVISMDPAITHMGTHDNLLGSAPSPEDERAASVDLQVTEEYPPTFIWAGDMDMTVPTENTRRMVRALKKAGVPYECTVFRGVDHGGGPATDTPAEGWIRKAAAFVMR